MFFEIFNVQHVIHACCVSFDSLQDPGYMLSAFDFTFRECWLLEDFLDSPRGIQCI